MSYVVEWPRNCKIQKTKSTVLKTGFMLIFLVDCKETAVSYINTHLPAFSLQTFFKFKFLHAKIKYRLLLQY